MLTLREKMTRLVDREFTRATTKHGPQRSAHEGYAVLLEEVDELWDEVKTNQHRRAAEELVQVVAMAQRMLLDVYPQYVGEFYDRLDNNGDV